MSLLLGFRMLDFGMVCDVGFRDGLIGLVMVVFGLCGMVMLGVQ